MAQLPFSIPPKKTLRSTEGPMEGISFQFPDLRLGNNPFVSQHSRVEERPLKRPHVDDDVMDWAPTVADESGTADVSMASAPPIEEDREKSEGSTNNEQENFQIEKSRPIASNAGIRKRQRKKNNSSQNHELARPFVFGGPHTQKNFLTIHNHHAPTFPSSDPVRSLGKDASSYLHLTILATTFLTVLYLIYLLFSTIRSDVRDRIASMTLQQRTDIFTCSQNYILNKCAPETRVPALEEACKSWENCMNQDPTVVGTARLASQTLAEIVNGFVDTVSWKTFAFLLFMSGLVVYSTTMAIHHWRSYTPPPQVAAQHAYHLPHQPYVMTPQTKRSADFLGLGLGMDGRDNWEYRNQNRSIGNEGRFKML